MSYSGSADTAAVGGAAVAALVALPAIAAVGATILAVRGVMWCGRKLEENYQHACQAWTDLRERARTEQLGNVEQMGEYLAEQLYLTTGAFVADDQARLAAAATQKQQLEEAFAHTRRMLADARQQAQPQAHSGRSKLALQLRAEIQVARDVVAAGEIARAQAALKGTPQEIQQALQRLRAAWSNASTAGDEQRRLVQLARQALGAVDALLTAIDALRQQTQGSLHLATAARQSSIVALVREAEADLPIQPALAYEKASAAEQEARQLMEAISGQTVAVWNEQQREVSTLRGMLASLAQMMQEAGAVQLLAIDREGGLSERIRRTDERLAALVQSGALLTASQQTRLRGSVELLQREVFALIGSAQQHSLATTIAQTLGGLGFRSGDGGPPALKQQGDTVHVQVVRPPESAGQRDEKVIAFDIGPAGAVAYDFSGYVGDSCVSDARQVFAALREKGVFLLDEQASVQLRRVPGEQVTPEVLRDERFAPQPVRNKTQAELASTLLTVLQKMGYRTIEQRTVGGSIELEAFQGQLGYRVVLSPDGEARILKDAGRTDVSADASDPLAARALQITQQAEEADDTIAHGGRPRSATFRQGRQQIQGQG